MFLALSLVALYSLSGYLVLRQFGQLGISGQPTAERGNSGALLQWALTREAPISLALFLVGSAFVLWFLRWALAFPRG